MTMDVLKPELIWVDGRCYRVFENNTWANRSNIVPYVEDDFHLGCEEDEPNVTDIEIVPYGGAKYKHTFHLAKEFFACIIGSKHATKKRLESETRTNIQIPKVGQDGDVVIIGSDHKGIISARHRINLLTEVFRKKIPFTHFISIPANLDQIIENFNCFKNNVIDKYGKTSRGIHEAIFQKPEKLHLTLGMFVLLDDEERKHATETLKYCHEKIISPILKEHGPINMKFQGVECMNDDPAEVKILFVKVTSENDALQIIADKISNCFCERGLLKKRNEKVKLHMTVMNTAYTLDATQRVQRVNTGTFDATQILNNYKDTLFGDATLKEIHISQRHTYSSNGFYQATATIQLYDE